VEGRLVHFEIRAADKRRAMAFWRSLFGWRFSDWEGESLPYSLIETGGGPNGGMYETDAPERGLIAYFSVDDLDEAVRRVEELGGAVVQRKTPIPGIGWFAACRDTEGNDFSLFESAEPPTTRPS
jgi:uncharacterized protein